MTLAHPVYLQTSVDVQVLSIAGFISAVVFPDQRYGGMGFTSFVCITGFLTSAASFVLHISNFFPDLMIAYIIVSPR